MTRRASGVPRDCEKRGGCRGNHAGYWAIEAHREAATRLYLSGLSASQVSAALAQKFTPTAPTRNGVIGFLYRTGVTRDPKSAAAARVRTVERNPPPKPKREKAPTNATLAARERAMRPSSVPVSPPVLLTGLEKPWTERKFGECAFPVAGEGADTLSCCQPTKGSTYCAAHRAVVYAAPDPQPPRRKRSRPEPTFYDLEAA